MQAPPFQFPIYMKLALIGYKGLLGQELQRVFASENPTLLDSDTCDITNETLLHETLTTLKPELVINAAAYTNVEEAETHRDQAFEINAHGARNLADVCREINATLVHYSTDYVVDGIKRDGYAEDDDTGTPVNVYGQSKLMGEAFIRQSLQQHYIIRLSSLFGPAKKNFVSIMLDLAENHTELKVVGDQYMKPTYAPDLAAATAKLFHEHAPFGIYHLPNEVQPLGGDTEATHTTHVGISWAQFAREIFTINHELHVNTPIPQVVEIKANEWSAKSKRPHHSALLNTKRPLQRPYYEALREYILTISVKKT